MQVSERRRDAETVIQAFLTGAYFVMGPRWRNGRRGRLKICFPQGSGGSIPSLGTGVRCGVEGEGYPGIPDVAAWETLGETINRYVHKGEKLFVEGGRKPVF